MNLKYTIGIDYGTQACRAILVEVASGLEIASAVAEYAHGVIDDYLPGGRVKLPPDWALQHPQDYLDVFAEVVSSVIREVAINPGDIIGLGVDFTASTMLPVDKAGVPLCFYDEFKENPHAYAKLWKHHATQDETDNLNRIAKCRDEGFLKRYGGKTSSEWFIPKIWQILDEAPEVYEKAYKFIEAGDWLVWQITGNERRSSCIAGYKALWSKREGYPSKEFFKALDPRMENLVEEKLSTDIYPIGSKAGEVNDKTATLTGLKRGTAVGVATVDGHASLPAVGIMDEGIMLMVMGTSTCHFVLNKTEKIIPGICGMIEDGLIPGFLGFEAGQSCVGDHFDWFINNCVSTEYTEEASDRGINIHDLLTEKASLLKPGESGLIALDWWNGNRSILVDSDLSGLIVGFNLQTKPEELYRALIEATAYGTRVIIETFIEGGIPINSLIAAGGIAQKNELMMQIYADVTNMEINIADSSQTSALGSAIFAAVAAGKEKGGYDSIIDAEKAMACASTKVYKPILENVNIYKALFAEYKSLHDYFGKGENNIMKHLKEIKEDIMTIKEQGFE